MMTFEHFSGRILRRGRLWLAVAVLLGLAACGNGGGTGVGTVPVNYARFGFSANSGDNTLSVYLVNAASGQWLHAGYVPTGDTPVAVAVTPNEQFVYVLSEADTSVSGYALDGDTGRLAAAGSTLTGAGPSALAASRNSGFLYVANATDDNLRGYNINASTGALTALAGSPYTTGAGGHPVALVAHPTQNFLYVANHDNDTLAGFSLNVTSGELTPLAGSPYPVGAGSGPRALTIDPQGRYLYAANDTGNSVAVFAIDSTTGVLTQVDQDTVTAGTQNKPAGNAPSGVAVQGGRYLYVSNGGDNTLSPYTVNPSTGVLTSAGAPLPTVTAPRALRADPSGNYLFLAGETARTVTGYRVNTANGSLTALDVTRTRNQPVALAFSVGTDALAPQTAHAYVVNDLNSEVRTYSASASSGTLSWLSSANTGSMPVAVAVDPFARFAYVVNNTGNSLSGYTLNRVSGALTRIDLDPGNILSQNQAVGVDPQQLVVDPSGRFVYVSVTTAGANGAVHAFAIHEADDADYGRLTEIAGSPFTVGPAPKQLAVDPSGQFLYAVNSNNFDIGSVSAFAIDPVSGALASLGADVATGLSPAPIAIDPSARFVYVANRGTNTLSRYSLALDGTLGSTGTTTTQTGPRTLGMDPLARFLYAGVLTAYLEGFVINHTNGALTSLGASSLTPTPVSVTVDPSGRFLYLGYSDDTVITAFGITATSGILSPIGAVDNVGNATSLALTRKLVSSGSSGGLWK